MTRKVMIGTPCYSGQLDVWYTNSIVRTLKIIAETKLDIEIIPIWISFDALLQRARNDTVFLALEMECDDLVFIDSDIEWEPEQLLTLLNYNEDVVGGTYPKKSSVEEYVVRQIEQKPIDPSTGLLEVDGLGTGFVKLSNRALQYLWNTSVPYIDPKDDKERRMIFDVVVKNQSLHSEDIHMFDKLKEGGFSVWLDPNITCNHSGPKKFTGDFKSWYEKLYIKTKLLPKHPIKKQL